MFWLYMLASIVCYMLGDYSSKHFINDRDTAYLIALILSYSGSTFMWLKALPLEGNIAVSGVIWSVLSVIGAFMLGTFVFKEPFTMTSLVGVAFCIVGIYLIFR